MSRLKKLCAAMLALTLLLAGCGGEQAVIPVVKVSMVARAGLAGDNYAGVVVSENAVQIQRDKEQTVDELYVSEGDTVQEGQQLFRYDVDALNLTLDRQELELDRLEAEVKAKKKQVTDVEKELKTATGDTKTQLNIQLRQLNTELTQAEYDQEDLEEEIKYTKQMIKNAVVKSPADGTVRKIDELGAVYILIQQTDAFQVQGVLNELNVNAGIVPGAAVEIVSRLEPERIWTGIVTMVDYGNTSTNSYDSMYGTTDALSSSTGYPFYVTLDSVEGLLLGQHVYVRLANVSAGTGRVLIPESYLMDMSYDSETLIASAAVWCPDADGKLVKQTVVLGERLADIGCYVVLEGLSQEDYVADPSNPDCREGAVTDLRSEADFDARETVPSEVPAGTDPTGDTAGTDGAPTDTTGEAAGGEEPA